jgi:dihydroorotate dehydrogenase (NAD+) catalytic subunit
VKIPVIGMGGIMNATDAIEFIIAGASAVQVGTAIFIDPTSPIKIIDGIQKYLEDNKIQAVSDLVGKLQL